MTNYNNPRRKKFLEAIPTKSLEETDTASKCKFNLSFFDSNQNAGQSFQDWKGEKGICTLLNLMGKLKDYSADSLEYWKTQRVGGGSLKVLETYSTFPNNSDFEHPKHVPHDVCWSRFRLGNKVRLIGFIVPENLADKFNNDNSFRFDRNTFYIVFLDKDHKFYKTEAK